VTEARRAIFVDRDGVLNAAVRGGVQGLSPRALEDFVVLDDAAEAVALAHGAGYLVIAVTNQPDLARGDLQPTTLRAMHDRLSTAVPLDGIEVCPHRAEDGCACRKPLPGMLARAALEHGIDLARSWMVGDRWVDVAAGRAAGVRTVLVETTSSWETTSAGSPPGDLAPDERASNLLGAVQRIRDLDAG
jgi:D-glycero-D-manno-heptose 1,7-bisphosphate phosphatase